MWIMMKHDVLVLLLLVATLCVTNSWVCGENDTNETVSLSLGGALLANNSEVVITDIGDINQGTDLVCETTHRPCCSTPPNRHGNWYYPDGTAVPNNAAGEGFYRGRGDDGIVRLSRRNDTASPLGTFTCEIPLTGPTDLVTLRVTVIALSSTTTVSTETPKTVAPILTMAPTIIIPTATIYPTKETSLMTETPATVQNIVPTMTAVPVVLASTAITVTPITAFPMTVASTTVPASTTDSTEATTTMKEATASTESTLFQLRLVGIQDCNTWISDNREEKRSEVTEYIVTNVRDFCQCEFTSSQIVQGGFRCFSESPNSVTFRAGVESGTTMSAQQLLAHIETWVKFNSSTTGFVVQSLILEVDTSCVVRISSIVEPECNQPNPSPPLISVGVGIGVGVAALLILILVTLIACYIVARKRSHFKASLKASGPTLNRQELQSVTFTNMGANDEGLTFDRTSGEPDRRYSEVPIRRTHTNSRDVVFTNLSCVSTDIEGYEMIDKKLVDKIVRKNTDCDLTSSGYVAVEVPSQVGRDSTKNQAQPATSTPSVSYTITENPAYAVSRPHQAATVTIHEEESEESNLLDGDADYSYVKIS